MDKWYGTAEATAYTRANYAARLDAMRLSDTDPFMLGLRAGDDPTSIMTYTMGSRGEQNGGPAIRQQLGAVGYKHAWKPDFKVKNQSYWSLSAGANHTDQPQSSWQNQQTYLQGAASTLTSTQQDTYNHHFKVPLDFTAFLNLSPKNTLRLFANLAYEQTEQNVNRTEETAALNTSTYRSIAFSRGIKSSAEGVFRHYLPHGVLGVRLNFGYQASKGWGSSLGEYTYLQSGLQSVDRQSYDAPHHHLDAAASLAFSHSFAKNMMMNLSWKTAYAHDYTDERHHRSDTIGLSSSLPLDLADSSDVLPIDLANSFRSRETLWQNILRAEANLPLGKLTLKPILTVTHRHEQTAYRRVVLDTLARRNLFLPSPSLETTLRLRKQMTLKGSVSYAAIPSQLLDALSYTDDTNPLYVLQGNPSLHTSHALTSSLRYHFVLPRGSQAFGFGLHASKSYDPIATVLHYDSRTGAYRAQKQHVRGGNTWSAEARYDRSLGKYWQLQENLSGNWSTTYGLLTLVDDQTGVRQNRQGQSLLSEKLGLIYEQNQWTLQSFHGFNWQHYAYDSEASVESSSSSLQLAEDIFRYSAQLNVRYHIGPWTFSLDPTFYLNRGYLVPRMNNNLFILNAEVSWKCLKNKGELILNARDLLNQETD